MTFNNLCFLFVLMPLSLIIYYLVPKKYRNIPLVIISLIFYAWGNPANLVIIAFSILFNYAAGRQIGALKASEEDGKAKTAMVTAVVVNVLLLSFYKYAGRLFELLPLHLSMDSVTLPVGLSFYSFSVISYIADVYLGKAEAQENLLDMSVYVAFFPKVISGPIVRYSDMMNSLREREFDRIAFGEGVNMFLVGLGKKVLLADSLGAVYSTIHGLGDMAVLTAWLGVLFYGLQLYLDFSGYSDMAIGLGKMFGFNFDKNFDYPYTSLSISEFWRRWHISLGAFFRSFVYIPLGGNRVSKPKLARNLMIVWMLTGIWHGETLNYLLWGIYQGLFIVLERFAIGDGLKKLPHPVSAAYQLVVIFFGWPMFFGGSVMNALKYYAQMFGAGHMGLADSVTAYYFGTNWILLLAGIIACTPLIKNLHTRFIYGKGGRVMWVSFACYAVMLVLVVACLVNSTYTSFLYAQF